MHVAMHHVERWLEVLAPIHRLPFLQRTARGEAMGTAQPTVQRVYSPVSKASLQKTGIFQCIANFFPQKFDNCRLETRRR